MPHPTLQKQNTGDCDTQTATSLPFRGAGRLGRQVVEDPGYSRHRADLGHHLEHELHRQVFA